jgi:hypothetical protein
MEFKDAFVNPRSTEYVQSPAALTPVDVTDLTCAETESHKLLVPQGGRLKQTLSQTVRTPPTLKP